MEMSSSFFGGQVFILLPNHTYLNLDQNSIVLFAYPCQSRRQILGTDFGVFFSSE